MFLKIAAVLLRYGTLSLLITTLTACNGTNILENRLSPNPELQKKSEETNSSQQKLPGNFPSVIPQYPQSNLQEISEPITEEKGSIRWSSAASLQTITEFYQRELESQSWEITQPFESDSNVLIAQKDNLQVKLSFLSTQAGTTNYLLDYQPINSQTQAIDNNQKNPSETSTDTTTTAKFKSIPDPLQSYLKDVSQLGVLKGDNSDDKELDATTTINRRTYAKWLVNAYNKFYENTPEKQIRLGVKTSQPAFSDVPVNDPDFAVIQGLAEAGFIPSPLTPNNTTSLFRPNDPLTREDLIIWKTSLDLGKGLPKASIDNIKETWGFQDVAKIDGKAVQALYADFQNGEQSNVRRVFGYTTLFQPKKQVNLAEAAATLWYFGYQGDGLSAQDILQRSSS
ncbi:MAG: S-layer homology domain-containing protein [Cyanobacteria bacterium P01_G01_bin.49]